MLPTPKLSHPRAWTLALLGLMACASEVEPNGNDGVSTTKVSGGETATDTETSATETGATETDTIGTDTTETGNNDNATGITFLDDGFDFVDPGGCDPFWQDCPEGEKCVPYASSGGGLDANKCVLVQGDGHPGDPCSYTGPVEASDDCDASSICWAVGLDDVGTCAPFCQGTADNPVCGPDQVCAINQAVNVCVDPCDPLVQDCPLGDACYWGYFTFSCLPELGLVADGPCEYVNDCPGGSLCVDESFLLGCADPMCCTSFCNVTTPDCPVAGTECVPFFERPVPGYEDLGVCVAL